MRLLEGSSETDHCHVPSQEVRAGPRLPSNADLTDQKSHFGNTDLGSTLQFTKPFQAFYLTEPKLLKNC